MAQVRTHQDCFAQLMAQSDQLFAEERYASAYHLLAAALHVAQACGDEALLGALAERAAAHRDHLDRAQPRIDLAPVVALHREGRDVYESLELRIATLQLSWRLGRMPQRVLGAAHFSPPVLAAPLRPRKSRARPAQ